jgi:hypothetical protein
VPAELAPARCGTSGLPAAALAAPDRCRERALDDALPARWVAPRCEPKQRARRPLALRAAWLVSRRTLDPLTWGAAGVCVRAEPVATLLVKGGVGAVAGAVPSPPIPA